MQVMSKLLLALLVLLPLAMAVSSGTYLEAGDLEHLSDEEFFATAFVEVMDAPAAAAPAVPAATPAPATPAATPAPAAAAPAAAPAAAAPAISANATAPVAPAAPRKEVPVAPRIDSRRAYAEIKFALTMQDAEWIPNPDAFKANLALEISKGLNIPQRRVRIDLLNPGPWVTARIGPVHRLDNANAPHAKDLAGDFRRFAMDLSHPWRNLPILAKVDKTRAITYDILEVKPAPKEKPAACQIKLPADVRVIEPAMYRFIKAFELDVATAVQCEPEQVRVTDVRPDQDGASLDTVIVRFEIVARDRELPEKEVTPTAAVQLLRRQIVDPYSVLRQRPLTRNADPFFPLQDLFSKPVDPSLMANWMYTPTMYSTAEILPEAPTFENPVMLPTLMVVPPAGAVNVPGPKEMMVAPVIVPSFK